MIIAAPLQRTMQDGCNGKHHSGIFTATVRRYGTAAPVAGGGAERKGEVVMAEAEN